VPTQQAIRVETNETGSSQTFFDLTDELKILAGDKNRLVHTEMICRNLSELLVKSTFGDKN